MRSIDILLLQEVFPSVLVLALEVCDLDFVLCTVGQELVGLEVELDAAEELCLVDVAEVDYLS